MKDANHISSNPMNRPLTNAEKQAAYRARRAELGDAVRLNAFVKTEALDALHRLARHYGVTLADVIGLIAEKAESDALASMSPAERRAYKTTIKT
jgi:hypothetical protein